MSSRKPFIFAVFMLLVLSVLSIAVMAQDGEAVTSTGFRPDAPTYGVRGSHPVGTRDLVIDGESPLDITVWYPASVSENAEATITYPYTIKMDVPPSMVATVDGQAILDAPYDLEDSPRPLVILSPGFAVGRSSYAWLAEHLASYGLVVVSPEHHERADETLSEFWQAAITRPQEIQAVLAYVDAQVEADGTLEGLIDPEVVAVIGHSYGGYTSLVMAGARYDIHGLESLCEAAAESGDPSAWLCSLIVPHVPEMAELAGLDSIPEGLWPTWGDARVDAIVPMAGDAYFFDQAGLAEITIPVMAIGGTADTGTPYNWGTKPTYDHVSSETKVQVSFENAEHMIFGATCEASTFFADIGFYAGCSDPVWDVDRAHDLTNHFTTAFLLAELTQDTEAAAALVPDAVVFPGVTYEAQGF